MIAAKHLEKLACALSVISFVTLCWVAHRTLQKRTHCVSSPYIAYVQIGEDRIENCIYESRLSFNAFVHPISEEKLAMVRALETLDPLLPLFPSRSPRLAVGIDGTNPRSFTLGHGYVRIGREWVEKNPLQTQRALIMGLLKRQHPKAYTSEFQLEVMTDFLLLTVYRQREWYGHPLSQDIKFPTTAPSFADYCKSPFRSLAHEEGCKLPAPDSVDLEGGVWGFRPLLASALWRAYERSSLPQKMRTMRAVKQGRSLPLLAKLRNTSLEGNVHWFEESLAAYASSFRLQNDELKRALKELEVEAPTHWEMTVDVTHTPAWREILQQFQKWARYRPGQRTLIFTPEGAVALPSGMPVAWSGDDVHSQKHVMIACAWPSKPKDMIPVTARHVFAKQSCEKVDDIFWN